MVHLKTVQAPCLRNSVIRIHFNWDLGIGVKDSTLRQTEQLGSILCEGLNMRIPSSGFRI